MALSCFLRGAPRCTKAFSSLPCVSYSLLRSSVPLSTVNIHKNVLNYTVTKPFSVSPRQLSAGSHDHGKLWTVERVVAIGTLGFVPAAFVFQSPAMDCLLTLLLVMHSHWGIEAIIVDYMRPRVVGPLLPKVSMALLYGLSMVTLGSLCYFSYTDIGLVGAIKMLWKL